MSTLALSMRPNNLAEIIGQETTTKALLDIFSKKKVNEISHFYILSGSIGTGKTTLARIIAGILQCPELDKEPKLRSQDLIKNFYLDHKKYDIREINASDKNGIDDIRSLIEQSKFVPHKPSRSKVIILDEAHQLTTPAQNTLLTHIEELPKHLYYIFCTSQLTKILPSVKRRAFVINLETLKKKDIEKLVNLAKEVGESKVPLEPFIEALDLYEINSTGLILQALEKYFNGFSVEESFSAPVEGLKTIELCRFITKGDFFGCTSVLKDITNNDVQVLKNISLGYLKKVLISQTNTQYAVKISKAIKSINESTDNSADFIASVCIACNHMNAPSK
jgi:DNA polymerase III gamma/tau subunit